MVWRAYRDPPLQIWLATRCLSRPALTESRVISILKMAVAEA